MGCLYGVLIWLIPFIASFAVFDLKETEFYFAFETYMTVVITIVIIVFSVLYFRKVEQDFLREGVSVGIIWFAISVLIDILLFLAGPIKMNPLNYFLDIGLTYLIYPVVTIGIGFLLEKKK